MCNHCHSLVDFAVSGCGKTSALFLLHRLMTQSNRSHVSHCFLSCIYIYIYINGGRVYVPMFRVLESGLSDSRVS